MHPTPIKAAKTLFALIVISGMSLASSSASANELAKFFAKHDAGSTKTIDHAPLADILKTYVARDDNGVNLVNYKELKQNRSSLKSYIGALKNVKITSYSRAEQFAYWANLYNALTIDVVLDAYPVKTIRDIDISPGLLSNGPWGKKLLTVEGKKLSLDDIEHKILRPIYKDPRIHYAVNCASISCPNLALTPFTGKNLETELDNAARDYVNNKRGASLKNGKLHLSKIYSWYKQDFGGDDKSLLAHLSKFAEPELKSALAKPIKRIDYSYDWNLNDKRS